ncbi:tripartite tricarboxylate transporter TctB family protein [Aliihoeflea sp. PC F10.4]
MNGEDTTAPTSPVIDLLAGMLFIVWALTGWYGYWTNMPLRNSLGVSADPGPALLALLVLGLLTAGGLAILIRGVVRLRGGPPYAHDLPAAGDHVRPLAFAASIALTALLMPHIGFIASGLLFSVFWLYALSAGLRRSPKAALLSVVTGAALTLVIYAIFAHFLLVPLPL